MHVPVLESSSLLSHSGHSSCLEWEGKEIVQFASVLINQIRSLCFLILPWFSGEGSSGCCSRTLEEERYGGCRVGC